MYKYVDIEWDMDDVNIIRYIIPINDRILIKISSWPNLNLYYSIGYDNPHHSEYLDEICKMIFEKYHDCIRPRVKL